MTPDDMTALDVPPSDRPDGATIVLRGRRWVWSEALATWSERDGSSARTHVEVYALRDPPERGRWVWDLDVRTPESDFGDAATDHDAILATYTAREIA